MFTLLNSVEATPLYGAGQLTLKKDAGLSVCIFFYKFQQKTR